MKTIALLLCILSAAAAAATPAETWRFFACVQAVEDASADQLTPPAGIVGRDCVAYCQMNGYAELAMTQGGRCVCGPSDFLEALETHIECPACGAADLPASDARFGLHCGTSNGTFAIYTKAN